MRPHAKLLLILAATWLTVSCGREITDLQPTFTPIEHASLVIRTAKTTIYVDPVGAPQAYAELPGPDLIVITHSHRDHLDPKVIQAVKTATTRIVGPPTVIDALKSGERLEPGQTLALGEVRVLAIPAYNLSPERLQFHPRGRDNGYVLTLGRTRVYVSGDTEDIPEMRALRDIDVALACLNLPYTMSVAQAASAGLEMRPKVVIPYHYRGKGGMSDLDLFAKLISKDPAIEVRRLAWYPAKQE